MSRVIRYLITFYTLVWAAFILVGAGRGIYLNAKDLVSYLGSEAVLILFGMFVASLLLIIILEAINDSRNNTLLGEPPKEDK